MAAWQMLREWQGRRGSCVATVVTGEVDKAACDILGPAELREALIQTCQAWPASPDLHVEF